MGEFGQLSTVAGILADLAGFLGLVLSIYVLRLSRRDKRPRLTVGMDIAKIDGQYDERGLPEYPPMDILYVDVSNPSERRIKVQSMQIEFARTTGPFRFDRVRKVFNGFRSKPELPTFLIPGDNIVFSTELDEFEYWVSENYALKSKKAYRPIIHDATGNEYSGNWKNLSSD